MFMGQMKSHNAVLNNNQAEAMGNTALSKPAGCRLNEPPPLEV